MPRLAGAIPKLRPSVIFAETTSISPMADIVAVTMSGASAWAPPARRIGGAATETIVMAAAIAERSTCVARRRTTVRTTMSASLTRSSSPVM